MKSITALWYRLTGRHALRRRIEALEQQHYLDRQENTLLREESHIQSLRVIALQRQLEDSRLCHGRALRKLDNLEWQMVEERRERREADRTWITRTVKPRVSAN